MIDIAYAMGGQGAAGGQGSAAGLFVPMILMFVIFYFLLIRPQQKKQKEHQQMIAGLKKGDRVVISNGIFGTITSLDEQTVMVEIAEKIRIKVLRANVAALQTSQSQQASKGKEEKPKASE